MGHRANSECASSHLVILHQLGQGGVLQLVHTQEAVGVRRSIYEEMFAAVLRQVGQGIASDLLTDSDQKTARHTCAQKVICSLYCENPCAKEKQVFQPNHFQNSLC